MRVVPQLITECRVLLLEERGKEVFRPHTHTHAHTFIHAFAHASTHILIIHILTQLQVLLHTLTCIPSLTCVHTYALANTL